MSDRLPHEKGFHVSWDQIHRDARALAWRLDGQGPGEGGSWKAAVAITRGGMAPAMIAARELDIRQVDTISVKSYDHQDQAAEGVPCLSTPRLQCAQARYPSRPLESLRRRRGCRIRR